MACAAQNDDSLADSHSCEEIPPMETESMSTSALECPVCSDLLCNPVVAPCGHDMCKDCYQKWCRASNGCAQCPICRAPLPLTLGVCFRLKRVVEEAHPQESKRRCLEISERDEGNTCKNSSSSQTFASVNPWAGYNQFYSQLYWGSYASQPQEYPSAPTSAVGTPVMDYVQRWRMHTMTWMQGTSAPAQLAAGTYPSNPCVSAQPLDTQNQPHPQARWQSVADVPMRLQCAREILALFCARSAALTGHSNVEVPNRPASFTPATLAAVRAVEVHLYRTAPSRGEYMERATLPIRVAQYVRGRASVLAAARQERQGSDQQEVDQPPPAVRVATVKCTKV